MKTKVGTERVEKRGKMGIVVHIEPTEQNGRTSEDKRGIEDKRDLKCPMSRAPVNKPTTFVTAIIKFLFECCRARFVPGIWTFILPQNPQTFYFPLKR